MSFGSLGLAQQIEEEGTPLSPPPALLSPTASLSPRLPKLDGPADVPSSPSSARSHLGSWSFAPRSHSSILQEQAGGSQEERPSGTYLPDAPTVLGISSVISENVASLDADSGDASLTSFEHPPPLLSPRACPPRSPVAPSSLPLLPSLTKSFRPDVVAAVEVFIRWGPARYPCSFVLCVFLAIGITVCVGLAVSPPTIETNFDAFLKTDVASSITRDAFKSAVAEIGNYRFRRLSISNATTFYTDVDVFLAYELLDSSLPNAILHPKALAEVANFEQRLREMPGWKTLCSLTEPQHQALCDPGISIVNYAWPSLLKLRKDNVVPETLQFDGLGRDTIPTPAVLHFAARHKLDLLFLPSQGPNATTAEADGVKFLRSVFRFRLPYTDQASRQLVRERWDQFYKEQLVAEMRRGTRGDLVASHFDGSGSEEFEVQEALAGDLGLAGCSAIFVLSYLFFHTRSVLLSCTGLFMSIISVPLAYVLMAIFVGSTSLSFASFLALFLVVGFGCDVFFVYTDVWRSSEMHADTDAERLVYTWKRGGRASFATTATTALSFFANLVSAIRALRQFGFFMGLCVMVAWGVISLLVVPLCLFHQAPCACWYIPQEMAVKGFAMCRALAVKLFHKLYGKQGDSDDNSEEAVAKESLNSSASGAASPRRSNYAARLRGLGLWVHHLRRWRRAYVMASCTAVLCAFIAVMGNVRTAIGSPSLFPEGHARQRSAAVFERFGRISAVLKRGFELPSAVETLCDQGGIGSAISQDSLCPLFWCNALRVGGESARSANGSGDSGDGFGGDAAFNRSCSCFRRKVECDNPSGNIIVRRSFVGLPHADLVDVISATGTDWFNGPLKASKQAPVLQQEWESGMSTFSPVATASGQAPRMPLEVECHREDVCFCNDWVCNDMTSAGTPWKKLPTLEIRAAEAPRALSSTLVKPSSFRVPVASRAKVRIVLGLRVDMTTPVLSTSAEPANAWSFLESFDAQEPWAQRSMHELCSTIPEELRVEYLWCWTLEFKKFLYSRGEMFPVLATRFSDLASEFCQSVQPWESYVWVRDGAISGMYISTRVDVHATNEPVKDLQAYKARWDKFIAGWNSRAASSARGAFHVSDTWVEPEVQSELIASTTATMVLLLFLAFFGMIAFTRSVMLSLFVVTTTVGVVIGLAFYIVCLMDWEIGLIEVIAIIYFVGYAVTYSLHIAHMYAAKDAEEPGGVAPGLVDWRPMGSGINGNSVRRFLRVSFALQSIGGATLSSAVTTAGSSAFLVLCTLTVFRKLGGMCLAVTVLSIIFALGPLPAALLTFGPSRPGTLPKIVAKLFGKLSPHQEHFVAASRTLTSRVRAFSGMGKGRTTTLAE